MKTILVGNNYRNWDWAEVEAIRGKLTITGAIHGDKSLIQRAISCYERGINIISDDTGEQVKIQLSNNRHC